ncbi:MAG: type VI secretion system tip protein VgrG [Desulfovibrio sp.]|nr:type VI secretion system tip protein VgrG [Desulfovibrio sp.]
MPAPEPWEFSSAPLHADACRVLAFTGTEAVGEGYVFDILLAASKTGPKQARALHEALMRAPMITLTGRAKSGKLFSWNGIAGKISYIFPTEAGAIYKVTLRPRSWRLHNAVHSRIFLSLPLPQLLNKLLAEEGLSAGTDFADEMKERYTARPFTCQYNESSFAFLSRMQERAGAYTYIRQTDNGDTLVLADSKSTPDSLAPHDALDRRDGTEPETVFAFARTLSDGPNKVTLRDYSSEDPGLTVGKAQGSGGNPWGHGECAFYGGFGIFDEINCYSKEFSRGDAKAAADRLASVHLSALACAAEQAEGRSTVPWLRAGCTFGLGTERYLIVRVRHRCVMPADSLEGRIVERALQGGFFSGSTASGYGNGFVCRPLDAGPYVPEKRTPRPVVAGIIHAGIDAAGSGDYAELDKHGRYKVKFPFAEKVFYADTDKPGDGNNSVPLRLMQTHAGTGSGIHFPLLKGVEVLTAFIEGDPDRPVILGCLPNASMAGPVVDVTAQTNVIRAPAGHGMTLIDTKGQEELRLESADKKTRISLFLS